jgi:hypothetical protein
VAELVADVVPDSRVEFAPYASPDARNYRVSCEKLVATLGFVPRWDVRRGVEEHYEAYRRASLSLDDLEGPRYQRLREVKRLLDRNELGPDLRFLMPAPA